MDIQTSLITPSTIDWQLGPLGLATDSSLTSAVLVSLFTDASVDGQRGWWADSYPDPSKPERLLATSRLWLLERGKQTQQTLISAKSYVEETLRWLVEDGLAESVTAEASFPAPGILQLVISIKKPGSGSAEQIRIDNLWSTYAV